MRCDKGVLMLFSAALMVLLAASTGPAVQESKKATKKVKSELPAAVAKAVKEFRPNAEIGKLEVEKEAGVTLYDIEFKAGQGEIEVAADGTVMDVATIIEMKDIPKPAADAINRAAAGAKIAQLEKSEVRAEIRKEGEKGKVVKLAAPRYVYEAELVRGKQKGEIQVSPEGKIVEALKWGADGEMEKEK
jgi:uncharacterized membrane protein YkoI